MTKKAILGILIFLLCIYLINYVPYFGYEKRKPYVSLLDYQNHLDASEMLSILDERNYSVADYINNSHSKSINNGYLFNYKDKLYYLLEDYLYIKDNDSEQKTNLGKNAEGFYLNNSFLYYAYGQQKEKCDITLGGSVCHILKKYQFRKIHLDNLQIEDIDRIEYESKYNNVEKNKNYLVYQSELFHVLSKLFSIIEKYREAYPEKVYHIIQGSIYDGKFYFLETFNKNILVFDVNDNVEEIEIEMPEFIRTFTVVKNYIYFGTDRNSLFEYNINTEEMRKIGYTN